MTEVFDMLVGNLEEEGLYTLGQAIEEDISLNVLEIECRHLEVCTKVDYLVQ